MTRTPHDPRITSTIAYMQCALGRRIGVAGLAARVHLPPGRFRRLFASQVGMDPAHYLRDMRLRRARLLIDRTFLNIREVMALVGYTNARTFSRDFRRMFGVAPAAHRGTSAATPLPRDGIAWSTHDGPAHRHDGPAHRHDGPAHADAKPAATRAAPGRPKGPHRNGFPARTRDPAVLFV
jgi:AraC-like DNA-binding protein